MSPRADDTPRRGSMPRRGTSGDPTEDPAEPDARRRGFDGIGDARAYTPRGRTVAERDQRTRSPRASRTTDPFRPALQVLDGGRPQQRGRGRLAEDPEHGEPRSQERRRRSEREREDHPPPVRQPQRARSAQRQRITERDPRRTAAGPRGAGDTRRTAAGSRAAGEPRRTAGEPRRTAGPVPLARRVERSPVPGSRGLFELSPPKRRRWPTAPADCDSALFWRFRCSC